MGFTHKVLKFILKKMEVNSVSVKHDFLGDQFNSLYFTEHLGKSVYASHDMRGNAEHYEHG